MKDGNARALRERAERVLPGGVDSPVRAYRAVPGVPPHIVGGNGAHVVDADGNEFIDFVLAYGPHILGHQPPQVLAAVRAQLDRGIAYGHTVELEVELAERIIDAVDSVEMVRFVTSGTEAAMSAIRLARAATGRERIVKFAGGYHGHADALLAEAGSGMATLGIPGSPGVPAAAVASTWSRRTTMTKPLPRSLSAAANISPRSSSSRSPETWDACPRYPGSSTNFERSHPNGVLCSYSMR